MGKAYTRKGIVFNDQFEKADLPVFRRFKYSLLNNPNSEIRVNIPITATRDDIERAIKHMQIEAENWESYGGAL